MRSATAAEFEVPSGRSRSRDASGAVIGSDAVGRAAGAGAAVVAGSPVGTVGGIETTVVTGKAGAAAVNGAWLVVSSGVREVARTARYPRRARTTTFGLRTFTSMDRYDPSNGFCGE